MASTVAPKRQDTRKLFENLSGAGKSIAVLTSGGDAQGKIAVSSGFHCRPGVLLKLPVLPVESLPKTAAEKCQNTSLV